MTHARRLFGDLAVFLFALGLAAATGCGSPSGGGGSDAAIGLGSGGAFGSGGSLGSGSGGSFGSGGGSGSGACTIPSCFLDVIVSCVPQGTCKTQSSSSSSTTCWSNGVRQVASVDFTTMSSTVKVTKPDGSTCWSYEMPYTGSTAPENITINYKDGSGRVFATLNYERATSRVTVACPGGQPQPLTGACINTMMGSGDPDLCPKGECPVVGQFGDGR
jgi:hypothetical protein